LAKTLDEVEEKLATGKPWFDLEPVETSAAVALVLREVDADLEVLFIRRADFEGDPWSGHLAFPGGRIDPGDLGPREAAERESAEELALDLRSARLLGRLSDVMGHAESIRVSAFVYGIAGKPVLTPNYEIREAFWTPLEHCTDASHQAIRDFSYLEKSRSLPTIRLLNDERAPVLWGITYKFMDEFMSRIERPIPFMPWIEEDL
jgi:8-oxo-dGTP pyrophosphatase MutT (NUDIX family)